MRAFVTVGLWWPLRGWSCAVGLNVLRAFISAVISGLHFVISGVHRVTTKRTRDMAWLPGGGCLMGRLESGVLALVLVIRAVGAPEAAGAEGRLSWPCRTGPNLDGNVAQEDAHGFPMEWDGTSGKNIHWKLPLDGFGHSVPIVGHGKIWLTAASADGSQQFVYGIDEDTGKVIHHRLVFENSAPEPLGNEINTYASPSCVLDGSSVYVHFGSYGTACLNPETAEIIWLRRDIQCRHYRGPGSSPILHDNLLILTFDGIDAQFLMALDKHTGSTVWRTERTTEYGDEDDAGRPKRDGDMRKAFSTPGVITVDGRAQLVSIGSRAAFGYDAVTGEELWMVRHDDFNASCPPAFFQNTAILCTGTRSSNLMAVRLDSTTRGDVSKTHVLWDRVTGNSDLAAPVLFGDRLFMVTSTGVAVCVNVQTGEEVWKDRIAGTHTASPLIANGIIYFFSEEGDTTLVRAADRFEILAKNHVNEIIRASPGAGSGRLYLRTLTHLYSIGHATAD
jgi:outer membrane protein assembly factor BamB